MNNEVIRNHYDTFGSMKAFGEKHSSLFAAGSRAAGLFTGIGPVVAALEEHGVKKTLRRGGLPRRHGCPQHRDGAGAGGSAGHPQYGGGDL